MGRGGASCLLAATASAVVAPPFPPNVPPNPHPGNGNTVAYDSLLNHVTARILLLDKDMGSDDKDCNDEDCNDKDCNDKDDNADGNGNGNTSREGGGRQQH